MVSVMDIEPKAQIIDNSKSYSHQTNEHKIEKNLIKQTMQLDLTPGYINMSRKTLDRDNSRDKSDKTRHRTEVQATVTSQADVVDDRKALRDALYQGIFHRHRRTIFAFGSFLRMLRNRNSQYNTIRSSSEGEEDGR